LVCRWEVAGKWFVGRGRVRLDFPGPNTFRCPTVHEEDGPVAVFPHRTPTHPPPATSTDSSDPASAESALVERASRGDRDAFGALVREHLPRAFAVARRVLHNDDDAEDAVQDAFLQALRAIDRLDPQRPFWPWLSRIVVNRSIDMAESRRVRETDVLDDSARDLARGPSDVAEDRDFVQRVRALAADMPPRQRLIVELHDIEDWTVAEIAGLTGSSSATVRWHLHMGRRALRAALAPLYRDRED
jgi:RNA polymerase sigma-70 factor (ECF subfamily)